MKNGKRILIKNVCKSYIFCCQLDTQTNSKQMSKEFHELRKSVIEKCFSDEEELKNNVHHRFVWTM